jgi:hypothetical protein
MRKEVIIATIAHRPGPFTIVLDNGDSILVEHQDLLRFLDPGPSTEGLPVDRLAVVYGPIGGFKLLDMERICGVEVGPKAPKQK